MSTQTEVESSYGVGNDFFKLWLDSTMSYTCALFNGNRGMDLESAQAAKHARLSQMAGVGSHTESILDIGCGWGSDLNYQSKINRIPEVYGFTLSPSQHQYCVETLPPRTVVSCKSYVDYTPPKLFDSVICIEAMEHFATPDDHRSGRHIDIYRDFFRRVHSWTKPGTQFGLQAITRCNVPRRKNDLDDLRHSTYTVFPGAVTPRAEDIIVAANPYYEVMNMISMRNDYEYTTAEWLRRLRAQESTVRKNWGSQVFEDHDRYLSTCVKAFQLNWMSLHQYSLRRLDMNH